MQVCVGGTFNIFHKGHQLLLDKAFKSAGEKGIVHIGVTKGPILKQKKFVTPYQKRVHAIQSYLSEKEYADRARILPIYDVFGLAVEGDYDAIVVSPETVRNAEEINVERKKKGKNPLIIIRIPYVLADDNRPISSTRIYDQEITREGRREK